MVLCAGLGTRLRPLTDWLAKPMVPIGDAPAVARIAEQLRAAGCERLVVNVFHRPDDLRVWAETAGAAVSVEEELLGTAGGVARAAPLLGEGDALVWNGDILSELDPGVLLATHASMKADATLAVVRRVSAGEGNVGIGEGGRIVRLRGERFGEEIASADFIGIHVLGTTFRQTLPPRGCLVGDVYIPALRGGAHLAVHVEPAPFVDVGSIAQYVAANRAWLAKRGVSSWSAHDAKVIAGARIDGSIIGRGAVVEADTTGCIVWPGTHVRDRAVDAILTPHGTVAIAS
jgi:mannose-1-phosphate guanylyltransferase